MINTSRSAGDPGSHLPDSMDPEALFARSRYAKELCALKEVILEAGGILLAGKLPLHSLTYKADSSVVTEVDHRCADFLDKAMGKRFPGDAILNEETHHLHRFPEDWYRQERCWIMDPLDSTSSYVHGGKHYGVILGLTVHGVPVVGMTLKPETGEIFFAAKDEGAWVFHVGALGRQAHLDLGFSEAEAGMARRVRVSPHHELRLVHSRGRQSPELSELVHRLGHPPVTGVNGSLKINEVARGEYTAFVSPTENPMSLWDLCATQVILEEAGGRMTDLKGRHLDYRNPDPVNRAGLVASNGSVHAMILRRLEH